MRTVYICVSVGEGHCSVTRMIAQKQKREMWGRGNGKTIGGEGRVAGVQSSGHGQGGERCFQSSACFEVAYIIQFTSSVLSTSANFLVASLSFSLCPFFFLLALV